MNRKFRETSHLQGVEAQRWSKWIWAMAPKNSTRRNNLEKRGNGQEGIRNKKLTDSLMKANPNVSRLCGVYEWKAIRHQQASSVVYVGSTCSRRGLDSCQRMQNRIVGYTKHGNHKTELINDALRKGYELRVRFKPTKDAQKAMDLENKMLRRYNYAWNKRSNGRLRKLKK